MSTRALCSHCCPSHSHAQLRSKSKVAARGTAANRAFNRSESWRRTTRPQRCRCRRLGRRCSLAAAHIHASERCSSVLQCSARAVGSGTLRTCECGMRIRHSGLAAKRSHSHLQRASLIRAGSPARKRTERGQGRALGADQPTDLWSARQCGMAGRMSCTERRLRTA